MVSTWNHTKVDSTWDTSLAQMTILLKLQKSTLSPTMVDSELTRCKMVSASQSHITIQNHGIQHGKSTKSSLVSKPSGKVVSTLMVQLRATITEETSISKKDLMGSQSNQERKSLRTQSSRRSLPHMLMQSVSTKSKMSQNGLDISKDKLKETKKRESLMRKRLRLKLKEKREKLKKRKEKIKLQENLPSRSTLS